MGIKDKQTYGEYYWAMQVEANKLFAEEGEKVFSTHLADMLKDIPRIPEMPSGFQGMIDALAEPPDFAFLPYLIGVGVNAVDEILDTAFEGSMVILKRANKRAHRETWLTSAQVNTLWARKKITEGLWNESTASEGYEDILASALYEAELPYPSISDLVLYSRYHGNPEAPWGEFQKWFNISPREWPVWKWLGQQRFTTLQAQSLYKRGMFTEADLRDSLSRIGWDGYDRPLIQELAWTIPNAMLLVQGNLVQGESEGKILQDIGFAEIHPDYRKTYLDAVLTKPATQDIIALELRQDPSLSGLDGELRKVGIHPEYLGLYKELAWTIPPVADIITMAVREAFTPAIASRFGQYEDFPDELKMWGEKKGLSEEWTKRYWAAHWSLPSANQGFEMLHRGVINESELQMLLRALDVMPFWRDRLLEIAYRRLTRVDIRRMYTVGVLTEKDVYEAYLEQGYNERDAGRMTDFTVRQTLATQSKFTARDVITAYSKYMISRAETMSLLRDIGVRDENISFIISSAEYKRQWALTESKVTAIKNLYKRRVYDNNQAIGKLLQLDLPSERVEVLMNQWYIDEKDKPARFWTTAQTLQFVKDGLITAERGIKELTAIGYDTEHINIYMKALA